MNKPATMLSQELFPTKLKELSTDKYRHNETPQKHVALLIETSNEYARGLLKGIKSYIRTHRPWSIYLGEHSRLEADLSWLKDWKGDGILARIENQEIADYIRLVNVPTVDLSASRLLPDLPCVETNDQLIAQLAAEHFLNRGFKHYAYCGNTAYAWSVQRETFFIQILKEKGFPVHVFQHVPKATVTEERQAMAQWVQELPKPICIMACYDITAQSLLEACRLTGVSVPEEAAILGVDNDDLLCNLSFPSLSSIQPNTMQTGYLAASLLDDMMSGQHTEPQIYAVDPIEIITRMSTDVIAVEDSYISEAMQFIRQRAYENIKVEDILRHIPLSRRALDHRFLKAIGRTPHEEIIQVKMKLIMRLLKETDWTLPHIAERLGFKHAEYMSVTFKKFTGLTPGAFRQQQDYS